MKDERDFVDGTHVGALDHGAEFDVTEQGNLAFDLVGDGPLGADDEQIGLNSDLHQLSHGMLRRLGLQLTRRSDVRDQCQVNENRILASNVMPHLTDRLEEWLRLDVTDGATDFHDDDVVLRRDATNCRLDLVGDMRNHLHRRAQIFSPTLFRDDVEVDPTSGDVVRLRQGAIDEALVVTEIEVRFRAVIGDEHLAMLERRHGTRIDVEIRVEFEHRDPQSALDEQSSEGRRGDSLAERRNHPAGDEHVFRGLRSRRIHQWRSSKSFQSAFARDRSAAVSMPMCGGSLTSATPIAMPAAIGRSCSRRSIRSSG